MPRAIPPKRPMPDNRSLYAPGSVALNLLGQLVSWALRRVGYWPDPAKRGRR